MIGRPAGRLRRNPAKAKAAKIELVDKEDNLVPSIGVSSGEAVFGAGRAITTRLPGPLLRLLCFMLAPLTLFVRSYSGTRLGQATWAECAQVIHDWIAPPLQSHHTYEEVVGWSAQAGLANPERLPIPTGLTAWREPRRAGAGRVAGRP